MVRDVLPPVTAEKTNAGILHVRRVATATRDDNSFASFLSPRITSQVSFANLGHPVTGKKNAGPAASFSPAARTSVGSPRRTGTTDLMMMTG